MISWNGNSYSYGPFNETWRVVTSNQEWVHVYTADDERLLSYQFVGGVKRRWTLRGLDNRVLREYVFDQSTSTGVIERDNIYRGLKRCHPIFEDTPVGRRRCHPISRDSLAGQNRANPPLSRGHYSCCFQFGVTGCSSDVEGGEGNSSRAEAHLSARIERGRVSGSRTSVLGGAAPFISLSI